MKQWLGVGLALLAIVGFVAGSTNLRASDHDPLLTMPGPEYDERGGLLRPEGYEKWIFVGTSLGITYSEDAPKGPGDFHNVYLQREAFDHYVRTGEFPEKSVFVMTNSKASKKTGPDLINKHGHFAGVASGLEVAVKDSSKFDQGWAYFVFKNDGPRKSAKAFPDSTCYDCHAEHGDDDNVFVQFYSVLKEARAAEHSQPPPPSDK